MSVEYEVGYKKPPKHSQFKKGQSGNSKGPPKGSKSAKAIFEKALWKAVQIKMGDTTAKMPKIEAMLTSMIHQAMKGDKKAFDLVMKYADKLKLLMSSAQQGGDNKASGFAWTEEHESLDSYLEHLLHGDKPVTDAQA
jgi:hypothetical protein